MFHIVFIALPPKKLYFRLCKIVYMYILSYDGLENIYVHVYRKTV